MSEFDVWSILKKNLHIKGMNSAPIHWKERDIWWTSIGHNIGHEQNGKNHLFERPVIVIKKFNKRLFWGIPTTTQIKDNPYYFKFDFKEKQQAAMLTQLRLLDSARLRRKMGRVSKGDFQKIKKAIKDCL